MNRFVAVVAFFTIFLAACGVERSSEDTLAEDATQDSSGDQVSTDGSGSPDDTVDGESDPAPTSSTTAPLAPPTTGAPAEVALSADFGDATWEITHGELNEVVVPTQDNQEFVSLVFGGVQPPGFTAGVLTERLISQALQLELAELGAAIGDDDRAESKVLLLSQVEGLYTGQPDPAAEAERLYDEVPYLPFLVEYQAGQDVLSSLLAETTEAGEGSPCVRHILVETEAEGDDIITRLDAGEDFGELALELSTGPSGPSGGDLGCAQSSNYVPEFATAVDEAELGAFVGPFETEFGWHVIVVDRYEIDGRAIATERLRERLSAATVVVDENLGTWDANQLLVVPFGA